MCVCVSYCLPDYRLFSLSRFFFRIVGKYNIIIFTPLGTWQRQLMDDTLPSTHPPLVTTAEVYIYYLHAYYPGVEYRSERRFFNNAAGPLLMNTFSKRVRIFSVRHIFYGFSFLVRITFPITINIIHPTYPKTIGVRLLFYLKFAFLRIRIYIYIPNIYIFKVSNVYVI